MVLAKLRELRESDTVLCGVTQYKHCDVKQTRHHWCMPFDRWHRDRWQSGPYTSIRVGQMLTKLMAVADGSIHNNTRTHAAGMHEPRWVSQSTVSNTRAGKRSSHAQEPVRLGRGLTQWLRTAQHHPPGTLACCCCAWP